MQQANMNMLFKPMQLKQISKKKTHKEQYEQKHKTKQKPKSLFNKKKFLEDKELNHNSQPCLVRM